MKRFDRAVNREERREQLMAMWERDKRGQAAVLSLCHRALPEGETLRAGMSVFDIILDEEYGTPAGEESPGTGESA